MTVAPFAGSCSASIISGWYRTFKFKDLPAEQQRIAELNHILDPALEHVERYGTGVKYGFAWIAMLTDNQLDYFKPVLLRKAGFKKVHSFPGSHTNTKDPTYHCHFFVATKLKRVTPPKKRATKAKVEKG